MGSNDFTDHRIRCEFLNQKDNLLLE